MMESSVAVCILGMHRSGTSALTRLLNLLGVELGNRLLEPSDDNPLGFWEQKEIVECHGELLPALNSYLDDFAPLPSGWENFPQVQPFRERLIEIVQREFAATPLWGFKDPRTCRLLPIWHSIFSQLGIQARFVLMARDPAEIHGSLARRSGYSVNKSMLVTVEHMLRAERHTRGFPRVAVTFDQVLGDWREAASRIGQALQIQWPNAPDLIARQVDEFLNPRLRHHRVATLPPADPDFVRWAEEATQAICSGMNETKLDQIAAEFEREKNRYLPWRPDWSVEQKLGEEIRWNQSERKLWTQNRIIEAESRAAMCEARRIEAEARAAAAESKTAKSEERSKEAENRAAQAELRAAAAEAHAREGNGNSSRRAWLGRKK